MDEAERSWLRRLSPSDDGHATDGRHPARQLLALDLPELPGAPAPVPPAQSVVRIAVAAGQTVDLTGYALDGAGIVVLGADLVLTAADGVIVILQGFVPAAESDSPPTVVMASGTTVSGARLVQGDPDGDTDPPPQDRQGEGDQQDAGDVGSDGPLSQVGLGSISLAVVPGSVEASAIGRPADQSDPIAPLSGSLSGPAPPAFRPPASSDPAPTTDAPPPASAPGASAVPIAFGGAVAGTGVLDTASVLPFAALTVDYANAATPLNVSVTLGNAADGVFTPASLAASGFADAGGGVYTFTGTAAASQTAIRQLSFDPTDNTAALGGTQTTVFTIAGDDGGSGTGTDATTTVLATRATGTAGADSVTLPVVAAGGTVDLLGSADSLTLADGANTLTVSNVETLTGGSGVDSVTLGTAGSVTVSAVEALTGSAGNDSVTVDQASFAGMTDLVGGTGTDTLVFSDAGSFDLSALNAFTGFQALTTTGNTTLTLRDGVSMTVTLDNASNTVTGGSGADTITGGGGSDTIGGGAGKDQLTGGAGADRFEFAVGDSQGAVGLADVLSDFADGSDLIAISGVADFDAMNGSDFGDLTVSEQVDAGGLLNGATDTVVTDQTTGNVIVVLDGINVGNGDVIDAADFVITA